MHCLQLNGFLGGVHLAVLAAFVCQNQPKASVIALISNFFCTYAMWPWPTPVMLQDGMPSNVEDVIETRFYMPIRLPCSPYEYCHSNVTKSTFTKIRAEFLRGHSMTRVCLLFNWDWNTCLDYLPTPWFACGFFSTFFFGWRGCFGASSLIRWGCCSIYWFCSS